MHNRAAKIPLYQKLADKLEKLIEGGTFRAGDRFPSVRQMSQDHRVSISTVVEAYSLLEDRGRIEGRPRSGYFVRARATRLERVPKPARHLNKPVDVSCTGIFQAVMDAIQHPEVVPFGAATPGDEICPYTRLTSLGNALVRQHGAELFRYTVSPGQMDLRVQIAKRLLKSGVELSPDDIITTVGASESLGLALRATTKPGDVVVVENPTYFGLLDLIQTLGLQAIEVPQNPETGMDLDALADTLRTHAVAACIVQSNFQNPMGSLMPDENKRILVRMCSDAGVTLIEDELYGDLHFFGETRPPSVKVFDTEGSVIQCSSFSKTISPGLRVGWIVPGNHYEKVKRFKASLSPANCTHSELVVAEFLKSGGFDRHLRRVRSIYFNQVRQVREAIFDAFPEGTCVSSPQGGFLLWVELDKRVNAEKLAVDALDSDISVVPGSLCSATCQFRNTLRINCGHPWTNRMEQALGVLGHLARRQLA